PMNAAIKDGPCNTTSSAGDARCFLRERLWRYGIEGILQVPGTPFIIGVSGNVAAQHPKSINAATWKALGLMEDPGVENFLTPPSDLPFLFAVAFEPPQLQ